VLLVALVLQVACAKPPVSTAPFLEGGEVKTGYPKIEGFDPDTVAFHHSELTVERRVEPVYPPQAAGLRLGDQRCLVLVEIGQDGVPQTMHVRDCPKVFFDATRACVMQWRWTPPEVDGQAVTGSVVFGVDFTQE